MPLKKGRFIIKKEVGDNGWIYFTLHQKKFLENTVYCSDWPWIDDYEKTEETKGHFIGENGYNNPHPFATYDDAINVLEIYLWRQAFKMKSNIRARRIQKQMKFRRKQATIPRSLKKVLLNSKR